MTSSDYWAEREAEALKHYLKDEAAYEKELQRIYKNMLDDVQEQINAFYGKYAKGEGITLSEAKKRVSQLDIAAYERKAKKYVKEKNFSKQANEEMRLYNATMRINRLEMLKANIGLELIAGHDEMEKFMEGILQGRTEEELKRQAGILGKTVRNNAEKAKAIVNSSFHNARFSDRIWMYQDILRDDLDRLLQTGLIQGKNPRVLAREIRDKFNTTAYNAERLMRTELARVQTEAQKQSFIRNGFDMYEFICNHHASKHGTCEICQGLNGKHFKVKDMLPGENAPPMHPHCRCSTAAWVDDDDYEAWLDYLSKGGTTEEWNKLKEKGALTNTVSGGRIQTEFKAASTLREATQRISDALGVGDISLGRMPIELANQYLEGVERFMKDFPMLKGYYNQVGTKTGGAGVMGLNRLAGTYTADRANLSLACGLHLKSTKDLDKLLKSYADDIKRGGSYPNESPLSTAIHELVHGIDHATTFHRFGAFNEKTGLGTVPAKDWNSAKAGISQKIIKQVREEMFGAQFGKEVAEKTRYLGSYARTSSKEELAEAISYEYVSESNPYSARILELFKEEVKKEFGE